MPHKKHLKGDISPKEQRMYEHILKSAKESDKYGNKAREVAAKAVIQFHNKASRASRKSGKS